jgi:putative Mn2+ efflux pump MntP
MTLWNWIENRVARLTALDIGLLKICVLAFGLMVAKLWPPLLTPDWKVFGAIFLITYIPLAVKLLIRKD